MELTVLFDLLKIIWLGFEIVRYFVTRKREKALILALEKLNQSPELENDEMRNH